MGNLHATSRAGVSSGTSRSSSSPQLSRVNSASSESKRSSDNLSEALEFNIVLLGTGDVGKSTLYKDVQLLYNNGFNMEEIIIAKNTIYANIVMGLSTLIKHANYDHIINKAAVATLLKASESESALLLSAVQLVTPQVAKCIKDLYREPAIAKVLRERAHELHLIDSLPYFIQNLDVILTADYVPPNETILRSRIKTTGIVELPFEFKSKDEWHSLKLYDVGSQRNERKKWNHILRRDIDTIIYVVSLSEYDAVCYEDDMTNRTNESLKVFQEVVESHVCKDLDIFLLFNKRDVFIKKLNSVDMSPAFPDLPQHLRHSSGVQIAKPIDTPSYTPMYNIKSADKLAAAAAYLQPLRVPTDKKKPSAKQQVGNALKNIFSPKSKEPTKSCKSLEDLLQVRDLLGHLCKFLDARSLCRLSQACYSFYEVSTSDNVWKSLCHKYKPELTAQEVETYFSLTQSLATKKKQTPSRTDMVIKRWKHYFANQQNFYEQNLYFMVSQYLARVKDEKRREAISNRLFVCCALDTEQIKIVLDTIFNDTVQNNLARKKIMNMETKDLHKRYLQTYKKM